MGIDVESSGEWEKRGAFGKQNREKHLWWGDSILRRNRLERENDLALEEYWWGSTGT